MHCSHVVTSLCRVRLERVTTTDDSGYLVFVKHSSRGAWLNGAEPGLVVHISGDTLYCLCALLRDEATVRPMPLDLLAGALSHGADAAPGGWNVVKVTITALRGNTYVGRVFFGAHVTAFGGSPLAHTDEMGLACCASCLL
jgi:hypothetical protein